MSKISFRPTQMEDAPLLKQWLSDPKILQWFPMTDEKEIDDAVRIWIGYSRIGAGLTALSNGDPCGFANLYIQPYGKCKHTCLFSIIVEEKMRGQGIGKALLDGLIQLAKEQFALEILHLEVYEGNPAEKLYQKMGFVRFGRQAHFIKENGKYNAKILMQKKL